jgi:hypothetical protein
MPLLQGGIVIWSGSTLDIPSGFQLCDGTNGTPDLRNKFIIGAGNNFSVNSTGGSANVTLPEHGHTGNTSTVGTHSHSINIVGNSGSVTRAEPGATSNDITVTTNSGGAHGHTITVNSAGVGEDGIGKNLPPYYALCYIQQL